MSNFGYSRRDFLKSSGLGAAALVIPGCIGNSQHLSSKKPSTPCTYYNEKYRPQFHFTPKINWMNDPNGLVYYKGEYHLFFQHNPKGIEWGNMTWGHAVSTDLVHWKQLPNAIEPDELGTIFSGSAVVDWNNTSGFQAGSEKVLVCIYTSAGKPFTQSIAYSNDHGRTWVKYKNNPVIGHIVGSNRDPKVIWHEPTRTWIMALYLDENDFALLSSKNLRQWVRLQDVKLPGSRECPDFFELPVDGDPANTRWVFWAANGRYTLGTFDGKNFEKQTGVLRAEHGANGYAAQTWSDIPKSDGRRIQISWMSGGKYPAMPFNQQMSFPCELTLRTFPEGIRMCRQPVNEIENIHGKKYQWKNKVLKPSDSLLSDISGDLFDIRAEIEPADAAEFGFKVRGETIKYRADEKKIFCLGKSALLKPVSNRIKLQILLDRTSIEVFGNDGRISMSSCFLPKDEDKSIEVYTVGGTVKIISLKVYKLRSIWG